MKWITRERVKVDRVACPWLIKKFVDAEAEGFRHLGFQDDRAINAAEWIAYDALYAYCQAMVRQGKLNGAFKS